MDNWHKTGCVLCAQNCGLVVKVENNRMVAVRPDKDNPRSKGYACHKGLNVLYHQYPKNRLTQPLKRTGEKFLSISWDQAIGEITAKMKELVNRFGPRCLAYVGASAPGGHFEGTFGLSLLRAMGSQYFYSSAGQEFSGAWWVFGRMLGKQYNITIPDEQETDLLIGWGWNGLQSHQMPRAPKVLTRIARDPKRLLVVIDPRKSETTAIADIHIPIRPGTDALLMKAMITIILERDWQDTAYIQTHVEGFDRIQPWFYGFDARSAVDLCALDYDQVVELCRLMTTRRWCVHPDLGIYMGRHSTLNSYLMNILQVVCGRIGVRGGNIIPAMVMPMGFHADERHPGTWRTIATGLPPAAAGAFPPAVMPEEILSDHPERLRAVYISACNPLRSYPDTRAYERAFGALDLLVVNDIVLSETARLAHYVLPCRTYYESWDGTFFPWTYPEVYFQMRRPMVAPPGNCLESSQIFTLMADKLGFIPQIPDHVKTAAQGDRLTFGVELMQWAGNHPEVQKVMVFVLAQTLGRAWDSANKAALWGMLMTAPPGFRENAVRAGFQPGADQGDRIFQTLMDTPEGIWIGQADERHPMAPIKTPSGKIEVYIAELEQQACQLNAGTEAEKLKLCDDFPLILNAGRHMKFNANTLMRNPKWHKGKKACTVCISPEDADMLGLVAGQQVRVTTSAGSLEEELEISKQVRQGMVLIPHGFGLLEDGAPYGINVNYLTRAAHRDPIGTPLHRYVPCRVEAVTLTFAEKQESQ